MWNLHMLFNTELRKKNDCFCFFYKQVSIVARQQGGALSHYNTESGDTLEFLYPGEMSAEVNKNVFKQQHISTPECTFFFWT